MGLLDDAIREHLELKRRRGADAEEVTRLEQEALGPPQRGEFAGAEPAGEPDADPVEAPEDVPETDPVAAVRADPERHLDPQPDIEPEPAPAPVPEQLDQPTAEY